MRNYQYYHICSWPELSSTNIAILSFRNCYSREGNSFLEHVKPGARCAFSSLQSIFKSKENDEIIETDEVDNASLYNKERNFF